VVSINAGSLRSEAEVISVEAVGALGSVGVVGIGVVGKGVACGGVIGAGGVGVGVISAGVVSVGVVSIQRSRRHTDAAAKETATGTLVIRIEDAVSPLPPSPPTACKWTGKKPALACHSLMLHYDRIHHQTAVKHAVLYRLPSRGAITETATAGPPPYANRNVYGRNRIWLQLTALLPLLSGQQDCLWLVEVRGG